MDSDAWIVAFVFVALFCAYIFVQVQSVEVKLESKTFEFKQPEVINQTLGDVVNSTVGENITGVDVVE